MKPDEHRHRFPRRWVLLSSDEIARADIVGIERSRQSISGGLRDHLGKHELRSDLVGTYGEFVAAKFLGYKEPDLSSLGQFKKPDMGTIVGVRTRSMGL